MTIRRADLDAGRVDLSEVTEPGVPRRSPPTPGEMLREEFMRPLGLSATRLAQEIGVPPNRIAAILNGTRGVSAETAILLGRRFGTSAEMWLGFQMDHDLAQARKAMEPA